MKRWAACASAAMFAAAPQAGAGTIPAAVQAKFDAFLQCVAAQKSATAAGKMVTLCGVRFDSRALACLQHRTHIEAETLDPKQFRGHTMYSFAHYCSVPPSLVGVVIEKTKDGRWTINVAMPAP